MSLEIESDSPSEVRSKPKRPSQQPSPSPEPEEDILPGAATNMEKQAAQTTEVKHMLPQTHHPQQILSGHQLHQSLDP